MALDPDDATPHDGGASGEDAAAAQAAVLLAQVRTVVDDPLRRGSTEILIGLVQNLIVATARGPGGSHAVRQAQQELEPLIPNTAREFIERVQQGYGRGLDASIGVLYCRFVADRIAETHAGYRRGDPRQVYTLLKLASEALLLQDIQEQREAG